MRLAFPSIAGVHGLLCQCGRSALLLAVCAPVWAGSCQLIDTAQYIERFMQYVQWPDEATREGPWQICVAGQARGSALHFRQLQARGRGFSVRSVASFDEIEGCHVLDLSQVQTRPEQQAFLARIRRLPVLSIGNGADFCLQGGHVCLTRDAQHQFDLNASAIHAAGLRVKSRLFRVRQRQEQAP